MIMSRHRALLAASQMMGGGGKQVNTITFKPYVVDSGVFPELIIDSKSLFSVSSDVIILVATNGMEGSARLILQNGTQSQTHPSVDINPSSSEITVISIEPQEDDNYIYEVVVEY